jgi:predicted RNA-binding protein
MSCESDVEAADEFGSVLADAVAIIDQFSDHHIIFGGDLNVDFDKHKINFKL